MVPRTPTKRATVLGLYQSGRTAPQIARRLGWPRETVYYTIRRWRDHGTAYDLPRPGKPPLLSPRLQRSLINDYIRSPQLPFWHYATQYGVSESTIRRSANKHGFHRRVMRRGVFIRPESVIKRLNWAQENIEQDWSTVIFTDEMSAELGLLRQSYTTRRDGNAFNPARIQTRFRSGRRSIMIWGAVARGSKWPLLLLPTS